MVRTYPEKAGSATFRLLSFADLPDEELPEGPFCFPQALGEVLRQRDGELERRARVRLLDLLETLAREQQQLHVVGRHGREQVLASHAEKREAAERVAGRQLAQRGAAVARNELQRPFGDEIKRVG